MKIVDWNGFVPSIGDAFTVLTWNGTLSGSASLNIDPAFAAEGIRLIRVWSPNSLVLETVHPATVGISAASATIITGGTAAIGVTVNNSAASPAANLNYTLGASVSSGSATLGPAIPASGSLAQSASQVSTIMATSTNLGANTVTFTANDPNSSNISQSTTATLTVLGHAAGSATVTSGNGFLLHAGTSVVSATISLSNAAGTRSDLEVDSAPTIGSGTLGNGPAMPYYVPAGTARLYTATFNVGNTPGVFSDTVTFASTGDNQSLPGANSLGSLSVSITGNVYSGQAEWNATTGLWGTSTNWKDTVDGGPSGAPGMLGYASDTATFGPTVSSGTAVVALDGAAPVLSNLVFSNSNAGYCILQGTGTTGLTLTGTDGSSPAAVTVISGTHRVGAPILLGSNLVVSDSGNLTASGNLSDGGLAKSLTLDGGGELILSGSDSYSGGTTVTAGTLIAAANTALPGGTSLTVGAGGVFIFDPMRAFSSVAVSPSAVAVPEPSTLAVLGVGAIGLIGYAWRTRRRNAAQID
jgi:autotransporter-associated beta strand protein